MKIVLSMLLLGAVAPMMLRGQAMPTVNPYQQLMQKAWEHAEAHGVKVQPVLSPLDATVINGAVPLEELHREGFRIVSWTTNDPEKIRRQIRMGVDGLISDRPDILQQVLREERAAASESLSPVQRSRLEHFDVAGHRGGRGLRPENTLPSFESGLDQGISTIETDTGVSTDGVSLIWHDQFLNPQSCRRADGAPYALEGRVYIKDISSADAQKTFICDKLHFGPDQKDDLALSPVAVAFAAKEGLISPYVPTYVEQLFRFVRFYAEYYRAGAGKQHPQAAERAATAEKVRFNLETKILPEDLPEPKPGSPESRIPAELRKNHTVGPQVFVNTLCGAIVRNHMESRAEVQSFDFRTLALVEEQYPAIPTYYLTESEEMLGSELVPASLRTTSASKP
jgi:glycerophosphoryl diester phosphodiesterase